MTSRVADTALVFECACSSIDLAIIELFGDGGVGRLQRRQVVGDLADGAAAERVELAKEVGAADPLARRTKRAARSCGSQGGGPGRPR